METEFFIAIGVFSVELLPGLNGIQTHDLCNIGAVLYQMSYQAN